jgi:hypothetical protein
MSLKGNDHLEFGMDILLMLCLCDTALVSRGRLHYNVFLLYFFLLRGVLRSHIDGYGFGFGCIGLTNNDSVTVYISYLSDRVCFFSMHAFMLPKDLFECHLGDESTAYSR